MDENLIPLFGMLCIFGLPVLALILSRVMKHRERMEMLRHGMMPPPDGRWNRNRDWTMPPPTFTPGPGPMPPPPPPSSYIAYDDPNSAQCTMRRGLMTTAVGFALLIGLSFIGYHGGDGMFSPASIRPGPWLLGGLIPMFVGVAQMIIALMSGAVFPFRMQPPPLGPMGGPPPPGQRRYGAPSQPSPPGPRYEELARPVPPPDRK